MTTVIFAKNVKDLTEIMLRDTTEDKTYARYTIGSFTEKIYADPQAGKAWRDARLSFKYDLGWDNHEKCDQKITEWDALNPEPQNIVFTSWWLEYQPDRWHTERIVYLPPEMGRQIDNLWTTKWDDSSMTSKKIGTLTMATILKRLGVETKDLLRERKQQLQQEKLQRRQANVTYNLERIVKELDESIQSLQEKGVDNLSGLMSHLLQAKAQIELAKEVVTRDLK